MARVVITKGATVGSGNNAKTYARGDVVEMSSTEQSALTGAGGTLRAVAGPPAGSMTAAGTRDQLGESVAASNTTVG